MAYSASTTVKKAAVPVVLVILLRAAIAAATASGITIPITEVDILTIAGMGYGAVIGFINWLKNRKKK